MDTTPIEITDTWLNIKTDQSLSEGNDYLIQNTGSGIIYLNEATSDPSANDEGHVVLSRNVWTVTIGSKGLYVRSNSENGEITITES